MPAVDINYLAVLLAAVAYMVVGALWYSPLLFGNKWMALVGKTKEQMDGAGKAMAMAMVGALVTAFVLAHFLTYAGADSLGTALQTAFWAWLGFSATTGMLAIAYEDQKPMLFLLQTSYILVGYMVMAAVYFYMA